ncbi:MAG: hypothetical protein Q9219_000036 [cf. Caloplaca sp. 3 TL-2023]
MSSFVSALSYKPFSRQTDTTEKDASLNADTHPSKPASFVPTVTAGSIQPKHVEDYNTMLSRAFTDASVAYDGLNKSDKLDNEIIWQPTIHKSVHQIPENDIPLKRDATTTGLSYSSYAAKKRKPGRPKASIKVPPKPIKKLVLRQNKPVQTTLPIDVWAQILSHSNPAAVLRLSNVCRDLRALLSEVSVWKAIRHNNYGADHPDPPPGITERQYVDLIVGTGCQSKDCNNHRTNKTIWAFRRRWCPPCLRKKTVPPDGSDYFLSEYPEITKCVPRLDIRRNVVCTQDMPFTSPVTVALRTDLAKFAQDFDEIAEEFGTRDINVSSGLRTWYQDQVQLNNDLVEKVQAIEAWEKAYNAEVRDKAALAQKERKEFFAQKVQREYPQLDTQSLKQLTCFQSAMTSRALPSERAWHTLNKKMEAEQQRAERKEAMLNTCVPSSFTCLEYDPVQPSMEIAARKNTLTQPSLALAVLARQALDERLGVSSEPDPDFVLAVLGKVFMTYQPHVRAGQPGSSYLTMQDAKVVYKRLIQPAIARMKGKDQREAAAQLRCPACPESLYGIAQKQYTFEKLMNHIWNEHIDLSLDMDFHTERSAPPLRGRKPATKPFPWVHFRWPDRLPILPSTQSPPGADTLTTITVTSASDRYSPKRKGKNIFRHTQVSEDVGLPGDDFVGNVIFVASQLEKHSLRDEFKTLMALEFATRKWEALRESQPGEDEFNELRMALLRHGICGMFERFRCRACCEAAEVSGIKGYFVRSANPLGKLGEHYFRQHTPAEWTRKMMDLPSPEDLEAQLTMGDAADPAFYVFIKLFPLLEDSGQDDDGWANMEAMERMRTAGGEAAGGEFEELSESEEYSEGGEESDEESYLFKDD